MAAVAAALWLVPSGHYLFLPNEARPIDPLVRVPEEGRGAARGGIYMVDILVRKASLFERLFPEVHEGSRLVPEHEVNPIGLSEEDRRQQSRHEMTRSQRIAVAVALEELGHDVRVRRRGAEVVLVRPGAPADGKLAVGDVIVEVEGEGVRSPLELRRAMQGRDPGEAVGVAVLRDGERRELAVDTEEDPREEGRAIMGVVVDQAADIRLPVPVRIDAGEVGGPSAGLAFALDVVDELGRDVDRGRRVVVTGEIGLGGEVRPVGGVAQKAIGARLVDGDVFVVPDANAKEARRYGEGLRIIAVSTFREALSALTR